MTGRNGTMATATRRRRVMGASWSVDRAVALSLSLLLSENILILILADSITRVLNGASFVLSTVCLSTVSIFEGRPLRFPAICHRDKKLSNAADVSSSFAFESVRVCTSFSFLPLYSLPSPMLGRKTDNKRVMTPAEERERRKAYT